MRVGVGSSRYIDIDTYFQLEIVIDRLARAEPAENTVENGPARLGDTPAPWTERARGSAAPSAQERVFSWGAPGAPAFETGRELRADVTGAGVRTDDVLTEAAEDARSTAMLSLRTTIVATLLLLALSWYLIRRARTRLLRELSEPLLAQEEEKALATYDSLQSAFPFVAAGAGDEEV